MLIERNVVFIYPISKVLQELKNELENNDQYVVYELDSVAEYGQLIGVMEHSVTFSSDLKKTESYLESCKQFVRGKNARNFLVSDKTLPPHIFGKLQKLGLNESIKNDVNLKKLSHKINLFFTTFDQEQKKIEEEKNKAVLETASTKTVIGGGERKKETYNSNEKLRVEKMATLDEEKSDLKLKKPKHNFDLNTMLGGGSLSNFNLTTNSQKNNPFLKSPFDSFQLKKVKTFDSVAQGNNLKESHFKAIDPAYGNNPHKNLGLSAQGELKRRKTAKFEEQQADLKKRNGKFNEVEQDLNKRRAKFEEQDRDLNRKKLKFEEVEQDLKKKRPTIKDLDPENKKRKNFEEVEADYKKKRAVLDEIENQLNKKKKLFEEVESEQEKKKVQFEELEDDHKEKPKLLLELEDLQKKKLKTLDEIDLDLKKKKAFVEAELEHRELKKLNLDEIDDEESHKKVELGEMDYDKKKGAYLEFDELEKKKKSFEEVEKDQSKNNTKFEETEIERKKKDGRVEENELDKKRNTFEGIEKDQSKKKNGNFEEVAKEGKFKNLQNMVIGGVKKGEDEVQLNQDKNSEEQTIDYSQFKKEKRAGQFKEEETEEEKIARERLESILEEPEYNFFPNESYGVEYLVIYNDFLFKDEIKNENLFKFIHFGLIKEFDGDVSFYLADPNTPETPSKHLYSGHNARKNEIIGGEFEDFEKENLASWLSCKLPTWKDETYQIEINEFVYPYFEEGEILGIAVCHFKETIKNHADAQKVELLIMSLKGAIMEEIEKNRKQ